ncbi:MAG: hypothetical protein ACKVS8_11135 [Phycisphaerales bacterium]
MADEAMQELNKFVDHAVRNTKCGASMWTTFRWLSGFIYVICWLVALPAELLFNRRIGRRHMGMLPVTGAMLLVLVYWSFAGPLLVKLRGNAPAAWEFAWGPGFCGVIYLACVVHRIANWWRFRSEQQAHSFSCGIPWWVYPPRFLTRVFAPKTKVVPEGSAATEAASARFNSVYEAKPAAMAQTPIQEKDEWSRLPAMVLAHVKTEWRRFWSDWCASEVPTGPFAWYLGTVAHPLLLIALAWPLVLLSPALSLWVVAAALAIFLKARIDKAMVVETIYDIFDARIEQEFQRGLSDPRRLVAVERRGFAASGVGSVARLLADGRPSGDGRGELSPELSALLGPKAVGSAPIQPA